MSSSLFHALLGLSSWDKWKADLSASSKPHASVPCSRLLMSFSLNYYFCFLSQLDSFFSLWWLTEDVEINCEWSSFILSCRWMNTTVGGIKLEGRSPITTPTFFQETVKIRWFLCFYLKSRGGRTNKLQELITCGVMQFCWLTFENKRVHSTGWTPDNTSCFTEGWTNKKQAVTTSKKAASCSSSSWIWTVLCIQIL